MLHIELQEGSGTIGVEKSAYHQLSRNEIGGDNPCSRQLSEKCALLR